MENIETPLWKWFVAKCVLCVLLFFVIATVLTGIQSLLVWIGGLFPSVENLGLALDAIFGFALVFPVFFSTGMTDDATRRNILVSLLTTMGIYISVVWYFHAGILVGCIVLLYLCLWRLHKIGVDTFWFGIVAYTYLFYSIGAYFAMIFNDLEPAINIYGIITLIIAAICMLFISVSE